MTEAKQNIFLAYSHAYSGEIHLVHFESREAEKKFLDEEEWIRKPLLISDSTLAQAQEIVFEHFGRRVQKINIIENVEPKLNIFLAYRTEPTREIHLRHFGSEKEMCAFISAEVASKSGMVFFDRTKEETELAAFEHFGKKPIVEENMEDKQ